MTRAAESNTCRSCGAPIVWGITEKGHRTPLDDEKVEGGNVVIVRTVDGVNYTRTMGKVELAANPGAWNYISHFATCKNANRHRRVGSR